MALCTLCQTIPFDTLPSVPESVQNLGTFITDNYRLPQLGGLKRDSNDSKEDSLPGFPWHESLASLQQHAEAECPLCIVVQAGVQIWLDNFRREEKEYRGWNEFTRNSHAIPSGQRLWLAKRFGGGDGFVILVENPLNSYGGLYLLTGVNFCVPGDSNLIAKFSSRPIEDDSGSHASLEVAVSMLNQCLNEHDGCESEDDFLPSRVLDVEVEPKDNVRLVECSAETKGRYISLSHSWGVLKTLRTTRVSYKNHAAGISLDSLPRTFLDAVVISRYLGIRYLWIDSLCIIQDDEDDWARESGRMKDVYSNAYLVVAANHANSSEEGCFNQR